MCASVIGTGLPLCLQRSKDLQRYNGELASREHRLSSVVKNTVRTVHAKHSCTKS